MQDSVITAVTTREVYADLVLDSVAHVETVLRRYLSGDLKPGDDWHRADLSRSGDAVGGLSSTLLGAMGEIGKAITREQMQLLETRVQRLLSDLQHTGRGEMGGDHDVSRTPFYKVSAYAEQCDGRYSLRFSCAGGYDMNAALAQQAGTPQLLNEICIDATLTTHDPTEFSYLFTPMVERLSSFAIHPPSLEQTKERTFNGLHYLPLLIHQVPYFVDVHFTTSLAIYSNDRVCGLLPKSREGDVQNPHMRVMVHPSMMAQARTILGNEYSEPAQKRGVHLPADVDALRAAAVFVRNQLFENA